MQTLNVGAGRSDQEYKAAEESRLAELRSDVQTYGMYFFIAAGLAGLGTGLLPVLIPGLLRLGDFDLLAWVRGVLAIGSFDLLIFYGRDLLHDNLLLFRLIAAAWVVALVLLGLAARKNQRWAFWAGLLLYAADMIALCLTFSIWAFGIHGFFVFQWFKGQRALGEIKEAAASSAAKGHSAAGS
jgi:hypothetical protein